MPRFSSAVVLLCIIGCQAPPPSVSDRLVQKDSASGDTSRPAQPAPTDVALVVPANQDTLARVNDRPIPSADYYEQLLRSHGLTILEQMISLTLVEQEGQRRGVSIVDADVQTEYDRSLIDMARTTTRDEDPQTLLVIGQQILDEFLRSKNIATAEYLAGMRRNAYLRKMIEPTVTIEDQELLDEFKRRFGRKAVVRHIVLGTTREAAEVRRQLSGGADFSQLAIEKSLNSISAPAGGLLKPFTIDDPDVPAIFRQTVFRMQPREISEVVKLNDTFQIFRLERFEEPDSTSLSEVNKNLREDIREEKTRRRMQDLERELFRAADIDILNPTLRREFDAKYGGSRR